MTSLFDPLLIGKIAAANRIVMAPLTRDRAGPRQVPTPLMAAYYAQRASAGLIVTEGTQISPEGQGYLDTPGLHGTEQIDGWRRVTDAVHAAGGKLVVQLWHVGRISHLSLLPPGTVPVSSTARRAAGKTFTAKGFEDVAEPRALRLDEMPRLVDDYVRAARNAIAAGFDGVEVHGANGYLLEQFLRDSINDRRDGYGGAPEGRVRLVVEVMKAIADEIGAGRTGIRLSPVTPANDAPPDSDPQALYGLLAERLGLLRLAFVHIVEGATGGARDLVPFDFGALRERFKAGHPQGVWIANNGYTRAMAMEAVEQGKADAIAFGRLFISNPDLVRRLREDGPLAVPRRETFYGGDEAGYTDYPPLGNAAA